MSMKATPKSERPLRQEGFLLIVNLLRLQILSNKVIDFRSLNAVCTPTCVAFSFFLSYTYWKKPLTGKEHYSRPTSLQGKLQISESPLDLKRHLKSVLFSIFPSPLPLPAIKLEQCNWINWILQSLFTTWTVHLNGWGLPVLIHSISMTNFYSQFNFTYATNKLNL